MPYLTDKRKEELDDGVPPTTPGDLTYRLTLIALHSPYDEWMGYMRAEVERYLDGRPERFAVYAEVVGCIACARLEWVRRDQEPIGNAWWQAVEAAFYIQRVGPYEDTKIAANGDVYPEKEELTRCV